MANKDDELIIAEFCTKCKQYQIKCSGIELIKEASVYSCPFFIKLNSTQVLADNVKAPYPIITKSKIKKVGVKK